MIKNEFYAGSPNTDKSSPISDYLYPLYDLWDLSVRCPVLSVTFSGETGIRTPGTSQYNGFQDRRNRPLCHLSKTPLLRSASLRKRCKGTYSF